MTPPLVILDDDPTGAQAVADVPVALAWGHGEVARALRPGDAAIHVLTNSRAHPAEEAAAITADAARAALREAPGARVLMRGDSTLRGHVWEEYDAVRGVVAPDGAPPLLLVPALPAAGRVTRGGVHLILRDGEAVPLDRTEYATDGALAYRDARLLRWADERSGGRMRAQDGIETAPGGVAEALAAAASRGRPAAVAPDAESIEDLEEIAAGLRAAWEMGVPALVRCAPTFAAVLAGTSARGLVTPTAPPGGVLVVCGSFVPNTTAQLAALEQRLPGLQVEIDAATLGGAEGEAEAALDAAARAAQALLADRGCAVVATSRARVPALVPAGAQRQVAVRLASLVRRVRPAPGIVVAKGGITSAVTASAGLGAATARVVGPLLPGVALWRLDVDEGPAAYVVVPGNVGGPELLAELVGLLAPGAGAGR
jgi:uncharacterized protein YgbK (DUF1537 family)